jgi:polycystin 1L2
MFVDIINYCTQTELRNFKETNTFGFGGSQYNKSYSPPNSFQSIYNSFEYKTSSDLQGSSMTSKYDDYDGDGYVYELRGKFSYLQGNLSLLQQMNWIDRQTRAVFVEFSAYNPNINMIMVTQIIFEFLPSGTILSSARFDPLNLFGEALEESVVSFKKLCQILFMGFVVYFMIYEVRVIIRRGLREYSRQFWSFVEWSIIVTAWITFAMIITRFKTANDVLDFFKATSGYGYIKLQSINESNQILTYSLGVCSFSGTLKILKMLRFSRNIAYMGASLRKCFSELISFSMVFFGAWIAFVQLWHLIFGMQIEGYSTITRSMESAFLMMLGKFDTSDIQRLQPFLGPIIFCAYNIVILFFALNIFISIIAEAFNLVRHEDGANGDDSYFDLFEHVVKKFFGHENKSETNEELIVNQVCKYKDHLSILPNRIDRLINFVYRVRILIHYYSNSRRFS